MEREVPSVPPTLHPPSLGAASPPGGIPARAAGSRLGSAALEAAGSVRAALALRSAAMPRTKTTRARTAPRQGADSGRVAPTGPQPGHGHRLSIPVPTALAHPPRASEGREGAAGWHRGGSAAPPRSPHPAHPLWAPQKPHQGHPGVAAPPATGTPGPHSGLQGLSPPRGLRPPMVGIRSAAPLLPPTEQQQHWQPGGVPEHPHGPPPNPHRGGSGDPRSPPRRPLGVGGVAAAPTLKTSEKNPVPIFSQ